MRRSPRHWALVAAAAGLGLAASYLPGCGGGDEASTVTVATPEVTTQVETQTVARTETVVQTETVTRRRDSRGSGRGRRSGASPRNVVFFRGTGDRILPPIRVRRGGTVLRWRNGGEVFSLFSARGIIVDSVAQSGSTFLPRGRHLIEVVASGTWSVQIPNARRLR